MNSTNKQKTEN